MILSDQHAQFIHAHSVFRFLPCNGVERSRADLVCRCAGAMRGSAGGPGRYCLIVHETFRGDDQNLPSALLKYAFPFPFVELATCGECADIGETAEMLVRDRNFYAFRPHVPGSVSEAKKSVCEPVLRGFG